MAQCLNITSAGQVLTYPQISDLSFRRHVLVQALIIMDFLISLSAQARERLASVNALNKSVMYMDQIMSEDDVSPEIPQL